jgi:STAS domain
VACVVDGLETHPESIAVDAQGVTFIDSSGLTALLRSRAAAGTAGIAFRISERSHALWRAADVAGIEDLSLTCDDADRSPNGGIRPAADRRRPRGRMQANSKRSRQLPAHRNELRDGPTAAPTARCRTASTRQGGR